MAKKLPEINSSSTADIAFLLLSFFLMTSNMEQNSGLQRRLPPMPDENQKVQNQKINRRNIIVVKINSADRLMAGNEPIDVSMLKFKIKEFLINANNDPKLPEKENKTIEGYDFSKANYGKPYLSLDEDHQKIVREAIPQNISEAEPKDVSKN